MATGATKSEVSNLVLAWSGSHLQWLQWECMKVLRWESVSVLNHDDLRDKLLDLAKSMPAIGGVYFTTKTPFFSLAPTRVVSGREQAIQSLHMGESNVPPVVFFTEAFGEETTIIERDIPGFQSTVEGIWPQAKRKSQALEMLETVAIELRRTPRGGCVAIDVGNERAMMALFANGKLIWSMTTEDLEGDGILYHVVNAMRRQKLDETFDTSALFMGNVEQSGDLVKSFERFFSSVEVKYPEVDWNTKPPSPQHWSALTGILPCE
tara:strand:+ start:167 stop:961 length:795 start_codon:yes stop_codon:yes gene_type:complete